MIENNKNFISDIANIIKDEVSIQISVFASDIENLSRSYGELKKKFYDLTYQVEALEFSATATSNLPTKNYTSKIHQPLQPLQPLAPPSKDLKDIQKDPIDSNPCEIETAKRKLHFQADQFEKTDYV